MNPGKLLAVPENPDQLIDHSHQRIGQQRHGNHEESKIGPSGGIVVNGVDHNCQNQHDGADDFCNGLHEETSFNEHFFNYTGWGPECQWWL